MCLNNVNANKFTYRKKTNWRGSDNKWIASGLVPLQIAIGLILRVRLIAPSTPFRSRLALNAWADLHIYKSGA